MPRTKGAPKKTVNVGKLLKENAVVEGQKKPLRISKDAAIEYTARVRQVIEKVAREAAEKATKAGRKTVQVEDIMDSVQTSAPPLA